MIKPSNRALHGDGHRHKQPRPCSQAQASPPRPWVAGNFHQIEIHEACRLTGIRNVKEAKAVAFIESDGCGVVESIQNNLMKSITWVPWPARRQSLATAKRPILTAGMIVRRLPLSHAALASGVGGPNPRW